MSSSSSSSSEDSSTGFASDSNSNEAAAAPAVPTQQPQHFKFLQTGEIGNGFQIAPDGLSISRGDPVAYVNRRLAQEPLTLVVTSATADHGSMYSFVFGLTTCRPSHFLQNRYNPQPRCSAPECGCHASVYPIVMDPVVGSIVSFWRYEKKLRILHSDQTGYPKVVVEHDLIEAMHAKDVFPFVRLTGSARSMFIEPDFDLFKLSARTPPAPIPPTPAPDSTC